MENDVRLGDIIQTRKPHPCGGDTWTVIRTGADIKIKCMQCGRIVMLDRQVYFKRRKKLIQPGMDPEASREE
ncbi:MAG: DUF951 domain-containing protein [Clostridiales bacterium]|nr:DUF951 domain-containing protein [Clostridiales bacterium]